MRKPDRMPTTPEGASDQEDIMTITVVANGPAYATDLRPLAGSNFALDYGTDDNIFYAWNLTDMTVTIHGGNDTVTTGFGNDTIFDDPAVPFTSTGNKSSGNDVIHAGAGNDTIFAGDGYNIYDGGDDTDTINYSHATVGINVNLEAGEGVGNGHDTLAWFENVVGSDQGDLIIGSSIDNVLKGGKGDDQLFGGDGRDTLFGGDNNDVLAGGKGADTMYGEAGIDTLDYSASNAGVTVDLSHGTGRGGDAEGDSFKNVENITGSRFADTLIGNNGDNVLNGGADEGSHIRQRGDDHVEGQENRSDSFRV
jgi:Ca2+-binding RTX toxin-like protein